MNRDTAITQQQLNMVNQVTPYGNLTYSQTGTSGFTDSNGNYVETPTYTATTTLSPEQQAILDQVQGASLNLSTLANEQSGKMNDYLNQNVDLGWDNVSKYMSDTYDSQFNKQWDAQENSLQNQLISSGIRPGSAAYTKAMSDFSDNKSSAYDQLLNDSYTTGVQTMLAERNQPINEISALLSGSQVQNPQFTSTPQTGVAGVDYTGLVNQKYQADTANNNAMMGGLFGLMSAPFQMFRFGA